MAAPAPLVRVTADHRVWIAELRAWVRRHDGTWAARIAWTELVDGEPSEATSTVPAGCVEDLPEQDYRMVPRQTARSERPAGTVWQPWHRTRSA